MADTNVGFQDAPFYPVTLADGTHKQKWVISASVLNIDRI